MGGSVNTYISETSSSVKSQATMDTQSKSNIYSPTHSNLADTIKRFHYKISPWTILLCKVENEIKYLVELDRTSL